MVLGIDHRDVTIRKGYIEQAEQAHILPEVEPRIVGDDPRYPVPFERRAFPPVESDFGLVGSACAGSGDAITAESFHFVEVSRVLLLGHRVGRPRTEL